MRVHHPVIADLYREVPDADVEQWKESGWVPEKPVPTSTQADWDTANAEFKKK